MYKDKGKQKAANRLASQRRRAKVQGMTGSGYDASGMTVDLVWPYTRHLTPAAFIAWCRIHKPSWLASSRPGDADYSWEESAVPKSDPNWGVVV